MAVPKRKTSRARTRTRRAQWKTSPVELVAVEAGGVTHRVPRRLVAAVKRGYFLPDSE